jgi:hypothetical protein
MRRWDLSRDALSGCVALALLTGCGSQNDDLVALRVGDVAAQRPARTSARFMYVAGSGHSYVASYPGGKSPETISAGANSACADKMGNAFLTLAASVTEYHNGGTTPIKTFEVGASTKGCASDPTTGNLAVTFYSSTGDVAIFANGNSSPTVYQDNIDPYYCGYDNEGNLFIDGFTLGRSAQFTLTELPKGGSTFETIAITPNITKRPGQVQWDGKYITVQASYGDVKGTTIYRLQISGSKATVVGTMSFQGNGHAAGVSWITDSQVLMTFAQRSDKGTPKSVGVWKYPAGGKRTKVFSDFPTPIGYLGAVSVTKAK